MDVWETLQGPTCWMLVCFFVCVKGGTSRPAALKWNTSALALRNRRWVKLRPPGRFFSGWNLGIPHRTPLEEGCIIFQVTIIFRFVLGGRARFVSLKNEIFQASFFVRDWDVKIVRGGYRSWMPWLAFFFLVENLEYQKVVSNWKIYWWQWFFWVLLGKQVYLFDFWLYKQPVCQDVSILSMDIGMASSTLLAAFQCDTAAHDFGAALGFWFYQLGAVHVTDPFRERLEWWLVSWRYST